MMKKTDKGHKITAVLPGSIGEELELSPGDTLLEVNGKTVKDVFDYHYLTNEEYLTLLVEKADGEQWELEIEKEYEEDLGLEFEQGLMDNYRSCTNGCIFCFIHQMPPGMRETLYFQDDDARLSFLQGNYITLTNMKEEDLERIILYKLAPINISVHTMNPKLRCQMLHNRFAGEALKKIKRLYDAGLEMNSQIVLCKGYNDGAELDRSIRELSEYLPYMKSLSVVPVGLSKYREGLTALEKYTKEDSLEVLELIHRWQEKLLKEHGTRFVFASDEWYLKAELPIPEADYYEGYGQIENGVGMVRSLIDEAKEALEEISKAGESFKKRHISLATGVLAAPVLTKITKQIEDKCPGLTITVYTIVNHFFGEDITVAGLLTGQDLIEQLKGKDLGDYLLLPDVLLRSGEEVLLDDLTVTDLEERLQIKIRIVKSDGKALIDGIVKE
jgi:putative radical SAM enzyme (TIGR03279 family)